MKNKLEKVKMLCIGIMVVLAAMFVSGERDNARAGNVTTVTMWIHAPAAEWVKATLPKFYEKYPNIEVKFLITPGPEIPKKLLVTTIAGEGAADVAHISAGYLGRFFAENGKGLVDFLQPPFNAGRLEEYYVPYLWRTLITADERLIGIPLDVSTQGIFYRRDVLGKEGIDPESIRTWRDYISVGKKVTRDTNGDGEVDQWMLDNAKVGFEILSQVDNRSLFDKDGNLIIDSPETLRALNIAVQMRKAGIDAKNEIWSADQKVGMKKGYVVTYMSACWYDIILKSWAPETSGKWGVIPLPENETIGSWSGGVIIMPEQCKHKLETWRFIEHVYGSLEGVVTFYRALNALPSFMPSWSLLLNADPFYNGQIMRKVFMDMTYNAPTTPYVITEYDGEVRSIITEKLHEGLNEGLSPEQILASMVKEAKKVK